jgi:hypothetical protein
VSDYLPSGETLLRGASVASAGTICAAIGEGGALAALSGGGGLALAGGGTLASGGTAAIPIVVGLGHCVLVVHTMPHNPS